MVGLDECVEEVRRFNRYYTSRIGVLERRYLGTEFSVTEARVIYEIFRRGDCIARDLSKSLRVDGGYMSRLLKGLERKGIVVRSHSSVDRREAFIRLTEKGRAQFTVVDDRSKAAMVSVLSRLSPSDRAHLVRSLREVERLLEESLGSLRVSEANARSRQLTDSITKDLARPSHSLAARAFSAQGPVARGTRPAFGPSGNLANSRG